jgi:hypothetical protein
MLDWMSRPRHPNKHIERAVSYAERLGWRVVISGGHAWGRLYCPRGARDGCIVSVHSTPRVPENHARHIQREIENCPHCGGPSTEGDEHEETDPKKS